MHGARARRRLRFFLLGALAITLYGGLLRFEALVRNYGHTGQPAWSAALERWTVPVARRLRPPSIVWGPLATPYVGGDPINYIRFAREMKGFYQAHVREPMFLALTRVYLWLSGGRDIAVSYASATGGTVAILATCLLGAALGSRAAGLLAGLALATEFQAIAWSMDGWRDDTFMLFVTLSAAAVVVLRARPTPGAGVAAGAAMAAACLTRISGLSFVVPTLAWIALRPPASARAATRHATAIAAVVCAALVAPYLINCWRATGDPFYALNYHTRYYRSAEGLPPDASVGALEYAVGKLRARPVATIDTAAQGLTTAPFFNKWNGWREWSAAVGPMLQWSAAAGALVALFSPSGRLLLVLLVSSLLPYSLTWAVGGGGEWRFTQHVYPGLIVLAAQAMVLGASRVKTFVRTRQRPQVSRRQLTLLALTGAGVMAACLLYFAVPFAIAREALRAGDAATVVAGERDGVFLRGDWSAAWRSGAISSRAAQAELVSLRLPGGRGPHVLTLRLDPPLTADLARQPRVTVFVNRRPLAQLDLTRDPARMGSYRLDVPADVIREVNRVDLLASHTVPAGEAGSPFAHLRPETPVAFRMWYARLQKGGS